MSTSTDFKILEIPVNGVNSYIPPIVVNEADNNGRRLKFTPTYEGQPVTGITSARMYYDPRPRDASSIGDYVDGTKDGDGWVFVIPPNTFTANEQGIASVSFTDADGETYTRSMPIYVESGGTKADSQGTRIDRLIATLEQMVNDFTMTADAETGPAGSKASVNVTKLGNGSYKLDFTIPKGDKGDTTTAIDNVTASVDNNVGTPSVDVTHNGPSNAVNIDFAFHNLKGTHDGAQVWVGWEDPTVQHASDVMNGDLWLKSPHYLTEIDPDNPTPGADTATYYTYSLGERDNSPSVLITLRSVVTELLIRQNGVWSPMIWQVGTSLTPGATTHDQESFGLTQNAAKLMDYVHRTNLFPNARCVASGSQPDVKDDVASINWNSTDHYFSLVNESYEGAFACWLIPVTAGSAYVVRCGINYGSGNQARGPIVQIRDNDTNGVILASIGATKPSQREQVLRFTAKSAQVALIFRGAKNEAGNIGVEVWQPQLELASTYDAAVSGRGLRFFAWDTMPLSR